MPGTAPIVIGVTEYEGGLLPVLDLALYFGAYSPITPGGKKIDKTAPDETAKSAAMDKITWKKITTGVKKAGKIKEIPPRYDSQTDWDSSPDFIIYNVIKGDELYYITEQFTGNGFDYRIIAKDNEIENPDLIFPEQKIKLKKNYIKK